VGVLPTPTAEGCGPGGAMPNAEQPSDHVPIAATFELLLLTD
jgi:hypothetical protein